VTIPDVPDSARNRRVLLMLALIGLGLAHHRTVVLLLPGLFVYLLWTAPALLRPQRAWLAWLAALLAPLLLYAYLPLRAAQGVTDLNGSYVNTWAGFWDHILARRYTTFFADNALSRSYTAADWWQLWLAQTGWLGAGLSVLGLGMLAERSVRPGWVLIVLTLTANLLFAVSYQVGDPEVFMLPAWLCAAALAGGGLAMIRRRLPPTRGTTAISAFVLLLLLAGGGRGAAVNRSNDWATHDFAVDMAKVDFPAGQPCHRHRG
jgi:4-amino-4-deoxy-L-arabinose transferase-like glycosyltransferase